MLSKKITRILLTVLLLISFFPVSAANNMNDEFILHPDAKNSDTSDFVYYGKTDDIRSEMSQMVLLPEFQVYLQKNGVNKDNYELKLVSPSSKVHPQAIVHIPNHEYSYSITNVTDNSNTANNNNLKLNAEWNRFKIANQCPFILKTVSVGIKEVVMIQGVPVVKQWREYTRYNLPPTGVLNYDPSAEMNEVDIVARGRSRFEIATKTAVPLGDWHTAYVRKDKNMYIKLA